MATVNEYKKSVQDEIDWKVVDQLHAATLNFSSTSLELKKMYFVLVGIAMSALLVLTDQELDTSIFITLYLLTIMFWFLDSFTYYYQEGIRLKINKHLNLIHDRNIPNTSNTQDFVIDVARSNKYRVIRSIFNYSLGLYYLCVILNTVGYVLFKLEYFK